MKKRKGEDAPISDYNEGACKDNIRLDTNKAFDIFNATPIKTEKDDPLKSSFKVARTQKLYFER